MLCLPPEIYAILCEQVDTASLALFCRISRAFQEQAQWILYHKVDLRACTLPYVKSWCMAVTRHSHLAKRVESLSLRLLNSALIQEDAERIGRAFAVCVNLRRLAVLHGGHMPDICPQTWMIEECGFRLERFSNTYFNLNRGMEGFFERQTSLRVLSLPSAMHSIPFTDGRLPNLTAIDASLEIVLGLPAGRPLQRIQIHGERSGYLDRLASLSRYSATLKNLTIVRVTDSIFSSVDIVRAIAQALPDLKHLGIDERELSRPRLSSEPTTPTLTDSPISTLEMFRTLESFTYRIRNPTCFFGMGMTCSFRIMDPDPAQGLLAFGSAMLEACGSMRKAAIGVGPDSGVGLKCVFMRDANEFVEKLDFDEGFWN
ncbi:hypothetical protein FB45DRAFT_890838 [Roridomyces roridus]|uniref:F-box domain-containing protein n=1 Tax=Roridomyces roridus TaxID=1738132 RepID=A0AAD7CDZ4_9AGAR|nr:hypothetical protein FB45DRAFT_890838 [Roridomyces roridus]